MTKQGFRLHTQMLCMSAKQNHAQHACEVLECKCSEQRPCNRPFPEVKGEETEQSFLYSGRVVLPDGQDTLCSLSFSIHLKNGGGPTKSFLLAG